MSVYPVKTSTIPRHFGSQDKTVVLSDNQDSFKSGQLHPSLYGKTTSREFQESVKSLENYDILEQGNLKRRGGFQLGFRTKILTNVIGNKVSYAVIKDFKYRSFGEKTIFVGLAEFKKFDDIAVNTEVPDKYLSLIFNGITEEKISELGEIYFTENSDNGLDKTIESGFSFGRVIADSLRLVFEDNMDISFKSNFRIALNGSAEGEGFESLEGVNIERVSADNISY